jgi:hypothetical protein
MPRPILYFTDVLSGRMARWAETSNPVISELWNRIEGVRGYSQSILQNCLVSSDMLAQALFLRSRGPSPVLGDLKKMSRDHFRRLHSVLLTYFVFRFCFTHSEQSQELHAAFLKVLSEGKFAEDIFNECMQCSVTMRLPIFAAYSQLPRTDQQLFEEFAHAAGDDELSVAVAGSIWKQVVNIIGEGSPNDLKQVVWFAVFAFHLYSSADRRIKASAVH